jgi:ATP-binding cassette subfamily B protein
VLWVGAHNVLEGTLSAGTLGQFLLYSVIAAGSLGALSEVWGELSQAAGAADRLTELLDEVSPISARPPTRRPPRSEPRPRRILRRPLRLSLAPRHLGAARPELRIKPGETVAIVGPRAPARPPIFSLLLRFYDPQQGAADRRRRCPHGRSGRLRERMAIVPQDVTIFAASIHENIAFGRPGASRDEVRAAAVAAQADEFIARLDNGYDTEVGERGITLSGGQRQRIAIARAILKNAPVLLLDEATSALDAESETLVQRALDGLMDGRTTLIIAHRLATVLKADRILVLDQGRVVEEGTHQSLIRHGGIYAKLARLQFDAGAEEFVAAAHH